MLRITVQQVSHVRDAQGWNAYTVAKPRHLFALLLYPAQLFSKFFNGIVDGPDGRLPIAGIDAAIIHTIEGISSEMFPRLNGLDKVLLCPCKQNGLAISKLL